VSFFCISATALILNDYFDLETDRINAPQRPIPSGLVTRGEALALSFAVAFVGMTASALLGLAALTSATLVWIVGVLYNWKFKSSGLPGNLMVAFSVGMTFVFGALSVGQPTSLAAWWFGAIAFLMDLGEEIASDAMDAEGDRLIGSRSLAIVCGRQTALKVSAVIFGCLILVSAVPFALKKLSPLYLIPILTMDAVVVYATVRLLNPGTANPRTQIRAIYLSGLVAVLMFIGLRLLEEGGRAMDVP
jgi:geranylgeranylglycerol-phosphate geranylgeranyltransferase